MERSKVIFGNEIRAKDYRKAVKSKKKYEKKFGSDEGKAFVFSAEENPVIGEPLGVKNLTLSGGEPVSFEENALIVGNIRMGYGHYRISMAIASAAHALGYVPYWLDLNSFPGTAATGIISHQNDLYSLGSRLSQKFSLFNKLVWEPINSEGFRKLSYNAADQKNAELMAPLLAGLPKGIPYVATHAWPAQAAIHAGLTRVVNAIPDNWPMALHLAEGSVHTVQTPSAYLGYLTLRGMDEKRALSPMPAEAIREVGHYVDDEFVKNIAADNARRLARAEAGEPRRFLLTVGGAGAQQKLFEEIAAHLLPKVKEGKVTLLVNVGDHKNVWEEIAAHVPGLAGAAEFHENDYETVKNTLAPDAKLSGVQVYCNKEIFAAVYLTNLLMRVTDFLVTKPSELAFYPIPKLMMRRVGGHEAWGAITAAELGDGTFECDRTDEILAMLDRMTETPDILRYLCGRIEKADRIGAYNGAYEVVRLAAGASR